MNLLLFPWFFHSTSYILNPTSFSLTPSLHYSITSSHHHFATNLPLLYSYMLAMLLLDLTTHHSQLTTFCHPITPSPRHYHFLLSPQRPHNYLSINPISLITITPFGVISKMSSIEARRLRSKAGLIFRNFWRSNINSCLMLSP